MTKEQEYLMLPARVRKQVIETAADTLERCRTTETNLAGMRELAEAVLRMDAALTEAEARATAEQSSGDQSSDAEQAIRERDEAEEFADRVLDLVLGTDRREWSSAYGRDQALIEVEEMMVALRKSSAAQAAPKEFDADDMQQQWDAAFRAGQRSSAPVEAQEPDAWRTFDGEGGYDYRDYEGNESYRDEWIANHSAQYHDWVEPLYLHPGPLKRELKVMRGMAACGGDDEAIQEAEIDLHRLQHIESAALQALGILWMSERMSAKTQAAFQTLRDALGGKTALRRGIEAAIEAGYEADHPPGADWWAGKKDE